MSSNPSPRDAALQAAEAVRASATGLVAYSSRGRVMVVGAAGTVSAFASGLPESLQVTEVPLKSVATPRGHLRLEGHLGDFRLLLESGDQDPTLMAEADLVVDLLAAGEPPLLDMAMPPFGYFRADSAPDGWPDLKDELEQMVGQFQKPRFFSYDADVCAHGRSGLTACNRCVDACPAQAITALVEQVSVDPYLCQGGGVCATVCPTGAMRYAYPDVATTLERAKVLIGTYRQQADRAPVVLFCDQATAERLAGELPEDWLPLVQEELASVGMEVWLSALAYGARAVVLAHPETLATAVEEALLGQSRTANKLLDAMGYPQAVLHWADGAAPQPADMPERPPAAFAGQGGKRQLLFMALDHLYGTAPQQPAVTALPADAPLGRVLVDGDKCTLCMACASVCPGKALSAATETPRLELHEANCVQCGLCQQACPESAITLEARLVHDPAQRRAVTVLNEEEPFCCVSCGTPFATRQVIDRMMDKLAGHSMFADEAARARLKMCGDCRVIDMMKETG